ncbi:MAG TPA: DUF5615 family PIN-like protein [Kamptonema sp.]|nr:DUF5615 family PIN-like protein [Kamptonema sp.]
MSLRLFLDEDSQAKRLVDLLRDAGHDVLTVNEVGLVRKPDSFILDYARQEGRLLLTRNCDDFYNLHKINSNHSGIFAIYQDADLSKNMSYSTIVKCIANLESSGLIVANQFIPLNPCNY